MTDIVILKMSTNALRDQDVEALNDLYAQFDPNAKRLGWSMTSQITGNHWQFIAMAGQHIVGMATMVVYRIRSGHFTRILDLVVARDMRRQGIAKRMIEACIEESRLIGATSVELTGSPDSAMRHLAKSLRFAWTTAIDCSRAPVLPDLVVEER